MMKVRLKHWRMSIVLTIVLVALCATTPAFADDTNPGILPPQPPPYGHTYGEWSNMWWQWVLSIPVKPNPLLDENGKHCDEGQSGPVWFLAETFGSGLATRDCTIPAGKALFFPTVNFLRVNTHLECDPDRDKTVPELRQALETDMQSVTIHEAQFDGITLQNYQAGSQNPTFSFTLPEKNILDSPECHVPHGTYEEAVSDGYYVMLAPLSAGLHTLHLKGATDSSTTEVTYYLKVLP